MIAQKQIEKLKIVSHPDPVLRKVCAPVEVFDESLAAIARRMCVLMHRHNGVGLAGPQVGLPVRIFVWNPTGEPENDAVFINPQLTKLEGQEEGDEGCLSIEGVTVKVNRALSAEVTAQTLDGSEVTMRGEGLVARIWQHENDHLNGRLILDYMSPAEEIANRRSLKELDAKYKELQAARRKAQRRGRR
ncbi:MAG: peptide deformylase [Phycisphaerales bacterium]|nr:peptide deformylase [Phycisphaerales bacterium]